MATGKTEGTYTGMVEETAAVAPVMEGAKGIMQTLTLDLDLDQARVKEKEKEKGGSVTMPGHTTTTTMIIILLLVAANHHRALDEARALDSTMA